MVDRTAKVVPTKQGDATQAKMVEALYRLCEFADSSQPIPADIWAVVAPGFSSAVSALVKGQPASLDQSLGLKRHGGVSTSKAVAKAKRDQLIIELAQSYGPWVGKPHSLVSQEMYRSFVRYEQSRWKREQSSGVAPHGEPSSSFWRLKRAGLSLPKPDHLRKILSLGFQDPV